MQNQEIRQLKEFLDKKEKTLNGLNKVVSLSADLYEVENESLIKSGWTLKKVSLDMMKETVNENLKLEDDFSNEDKQEYWDRVNSCIDLKNSEINEVIIDNNIGGAFWRFYYLIVDHTKNLALFMSGEADD